jgi:hypothetical protein
MTAGEEVRMAHAGSDTEKQESPANGDGPWDKNQKLATLVLPESTAKDLLYALTLALGKSVVGGSRPSNQ